MTSTPTSGTSSAPVIVVPYDASWPGMFEVEQRILARVLAPWLAGPIEHVGSTAVPGLDAKPVIDIMVAVRSLEASRAAIPAAEDAGYLYWPYKADVMHWFCKPSDAHRTHHLHLVPHASQLWRARLAFRDALRADASLARRYARLKHELARRYRDDREAYTQSKSAFIRQVLADVGLAPDDA